MLLLLTALMHLVHIITSFTINLPVIPVRPLCTCTFQWIYHMKFVHSPFLLIEYAHFPYCTKFLPFFFLLFVNTIKAWIPYVVFFSKLVTLNHVIIDIQKS